MTPLAALLRTPRARRALSLAERGVLGADFRCARPVLFVLGLPRSGTTLVQQYAVHRLRLAYFTNGVGAHPEAPLLTTCAQRLLHRAYRSDFESDYGRVRGPVAPREAGAVWGRFFGFEDYVRFEDVAPESVRTLRRLVAATQLFCGGLPFLNKNVKHLLRIDALARIFPEARFLVVRRRLAHTALSVLRARRKLLDDPRDWWSVKPPRYALLRGLPPVEQVAGQLVGLRDRLHLDLARLEPQRVLWLDYADFCAEPESLTRMLVAALGGPALRNQPVARFEEHRPTPRDAEESRLLTLLDGDAE